MYLFNRRTRLVGGNGTAGLEWATAITEKAAAVTGQEVQLWATVYSPGYGTISWTAWFTDLASVEKADDAMNGDAEMTKLGDLGAKFTDGSLDDGIFQPIHGTPDPAREIQYVGSVAAVAASGNIERALGFGVEVAQKVEAITGMTCMFAQALSGPYGSVGWLTAYDNVAAIESAQSAMAADASFLKLVDSSAGYFVEDTSITQQTFHRRLA
jgi:hypothetical protein